MPTSNLNITHIAAAQNNKEVTANAAFDTLDNAMNKTVGVDFSTSPVTYTQANMATGHVFRPSAALAANVEFIVPVINRVFVVANTDATYDIDVSVGATATGTITVPPGEKYLFATTGTAGQLYQVGGGSGGLVNVVEDTTPQLGGNLDVNGNSIVSVSDGDIAITPNGTGKIILDGLNWPTADGTTDQVLKTDGAGNLSFATASGSSSSTVNTQAGTTYTLVIGDANNFVEMTNGSANTVTIPTNASVAYPVGTSIVIIRTGAGTTTVEGDTGVSINGVSAGSTDIGSAYQAVSLVKSGTDSWVANGGDIVGNNISLPTADTADFDIVDADLVGNVILRADSGSAIVVTVPPSLTGTEPVTVVRKGAGAVSFAAGSGVTINSADGYLNLRAQYSSATLIKEAADTFLLIGDLSA